MSPDPFDQVVTLAKELRQCEAELHRLDKERKALEARQLEIEDIIDRTPATTMAGIEVQVRALAVMAEATDWCDRHALATKTIVAGLRALRRAAP
jgi:hypothetical protein